MHYYTSEAERLAAIGRGETTPRLSTVHNGAKHYAVIRYYTDGRREIARNLTCTDLDTLAAAEQLAQRMDHGPFGPGIAGYAAERIA